MSRPEISVVVPVYGCRNTIDPLVEAVDRALTGAELSWELVLVDDRAPDDPWELIDAHARRDPRVRGVRLARNHGQHLAIWAGLEQARGSYVCIMDCDLQDDPEIIPQLHRAIRERGDEAIIVDRGQWEDSRFRRFASTTFYAAVNKLAGVRLANIGNFGLYSRSMVDTLLSFREQEVFLPLMVALSGLKTSNLSVDRSARHEGRSAYSFSRLARLAVAIIVRFSDRPLKFSILIGLLISTLAAIFAVVIFVAWASGRFTVPGWTSSILSIWFLSGVILFVLGVHGLYIGRIFAEVKRRPRVVIERITKRIEARRDDASS